MPVSPIRYVALFLLPSLLLSGCSKPDLLADHLTGRSTSIVGPAHGLHACLDYTLSDGKQLLVPATRLFADSVDQVVGASPRFIVSTRGITYYSRPDVPRNVLVPAFRIPATPATPSLSSNPFWSDAQKQQAQQRYTAQLRAWKNQLATIRMQVRRSTDQIRALHMHASRQGTDLTGCLYASADEATPGENWLYIASDLEPYQFQDHGSLHLSRWHIRLVVLCQTQADVCQHRVRQFQTLLRQAGAKDIVTYDATQIPIITGMFGGH